MRTIGLALLLIGCGAPSRDVTPDGQPGTDSGSGSSDDGCSGAAKQVYVIDADNTFSTFDPVTRTFAPLGTLSCPSSASPYSMGIDRNATAWVLFDDGAVFHVDTTTLACTHATSLSGNLQNFGMGFSTTMANGTTDQLFIAGGTIAAGADRTSNSTLATFDTTTLQITNVGTISGWPELTGTSEAQLWGYFPGDGTTHISQLDKTNGHVLQTLPEHTIGSSGDAYAFAAYGGEFWVFSGPAGGTSVYEINTSGAIMTTTHTTKTIVGAGVSTCAPVVIQ
ncbi:MAG TPA: hypothetical protein VGM90_41560 [Kofleriaceae bacterium]|jgi:hypothetical protein